MSQNRPLLENWTPELADRMGKAIFVGQHRLQELDLFNDQQLIELLDRHPRPDLGINTMGTDPQWHEDWQEGRAGKLRGEELLQAAQQGRIWLNMRKVMEHHTEYANLVYSLYEELESVCPGLVTFNRSANLLISSPEAMVYFHIDRPINMLWHLRGTKRVWAYPLEMGIVSDDAKEAILSGEKSEELEFRLEWDDEAVVYDLQPGEMVTWPQHTPHRVENTTGLNVSLSTEHFTRAGARRNNVYMANRHFRQIFPGEYRSLEFTGWRPAVKEFVLRTVRRIPGLAPSPAQARHFSITFEVDLEAPNCVRQLDAAEQPKPVSIA